MKVPRRSDSLASIAVLVAVGALFLIQGWRRWNHVLVDFGRELYVPWRLSLGEVLYRDVAYFNGPLSPFLNATLFRIVGPSYLVLALFNIFLMGAVLWLLYRLLSSLADRMTATVGGVLFLVIFALADLTRAGNYNFVAPYSHEMTHGSLLGLLTLTLIIGYLRKPSELRLFGTGLLLGLVFLTKAEFFLASLAAVAAVIFFENRKGDRSLHGLTDHLASISGGFLLPLLLAWVYLWTDMSASDAMRGVLGPWPYLFDSELGQLLFYRKGMGTDAPGQNLATMLIWLLIYGALLAPPIVVALRTPPGSNSRRWIALGAAVWTGGLLILATPSIDLTDLPRPIPVVLAICLVIMVLKELKFEKTEDETAWKSTAYLAFTIYALVLLAKMALHPRFHNYGFALAMPATMMLVALLLYLVPTRIDERGGYGPAFRLASLVFLLLVGLVFAWPSMLVYQEKDLPFGTGSDMFRIQARFGVIQNLLEQLPDWVGPDETLVVLPEGVMLNYQLRLENPTPHINFMPPELIMFGEDKIVAALDKTPPDAIVLIKRSTQEYGFEALGSGYGENLMAWVSTHYPVAATLEDPELYGASYGRALILKRAEEGVGAPPESEAPTE